MYSPDPNDTAEPSANSLFCVDDGHGDNATFVLAPTLRAALAKYRETVVKYVNEDYKADGVGHTLTVDEVEDPDSIYLVALPEQLML